MTRVSRRNLLKVGAAASLAAGCVHVPQAKPPETSDPFLIDLRREPDRVLPLWPGRPPGLTDLPLEQSITERDNRSGLRDRALTDITTPTLSVFKSDLPAKASMLLIPGGGYQRVVVDKEGYEGARYFNAQGFDAYVMNYRLPHQGWRAGPDTPLQDAQRALRLCRHLAGSDQNLLVMGFSAGGHLAGSLAQRFADEVYQAQDEIDHLSARPDLAALIYPVALMGSEFSHAGSEERLLGDTPSKADLLKYDLSTRPNPAGPPLFLLHALDDTSVPFENSLALAGSYRNAGIAAVLHTFAKGGHGFGFRGLANTPLESWPKLLTDWATAYL